MDQPQSDSSGSSATSINGQQTYSVQLSPDTVSQTIYAVSGVIVLVLLLCLRFLKLPDLTECRRVPKMLLVAIIGAFLFVAVDIVQQFPSCFSDTACLQATGVGLGLGDFLVSVAFGAAALTRIMAMAEPDHKRYVRHFAWVPLLYPVVDAVRILAVFGIVAKRDGELAYVIGTAAFVVNAFGMELYVNYAISRGLNAHWFAPYRRERARLLVVMVVNLLGMSAASAFAMFCPQIGDPLLLLATAIHIFVFCLVNDLMQTAYRNSKAMPRAILEGRFSLRLPRSPVATARNLPPC